MPNLIVHLLYSFKIHLTKIITSKPVMNYWLPIFEGYMLDRLLQIILQSMLS